MVAPFFFVLLFGFLNLAYFASSDSSVNVMARQGARFASLSPTSWSSASSPPSNSIEGQIEAASAGNPVPNTDASIKITYYTYDPSTGAVAECGYFSQAAATFVPTTVIPESTCTSAGNLVAIAVSRHFVPVAPAISFVTSVYQQVWMEIE